MTDALASLVDAGALTSLDVHLARTLARLVGETTPSVLLGAALASRAVAHGHVCADLQRLATRGLVDEAGTQVDTALPTTAGWTMELAMSSLVGGADASTPLVLDDRGRLYLRRYFGYQSRLAAAIGRRAQRRVEVDRDLLADGLARLFAGEAPAHPRQRLAAIVSALRAFAVVSGGPGTGKTTTVVRILALLQEQALARGRVLRVALLAPTGKAAARMRESIAAQKKTLAVSEAVRAAIPEAATTIHRCLRPLPGHSTRFRHDASDPLSVDLVVVDEASMVDLALMAKLLDAVPDDGRVILLGDKDQLASVEAGAILGDVCNAGNAHAYSDGFAQEVASLDRECADGMATVAAPPAIADCIVELVHNYRFAGGGAIAELAAAIRNGDATATLDRLERGGDHVGLALLGDVDAAAPLVSELVVESHRAALATHDPAERLQRLGESRLLCAHRRGPVGVEGVNRTVERVLDDLGLVDASDRWYDGRPILITHNDYELQLFNGDAGVIVREAGGRARACFADGNGGVRRIVPARLPPHETVYAMTVHKSQGSEFDRIALLVPPAISPVLTRELLYTAVTRARTRAVLYGTPAVLRESIGRVIERASGLREALWGA